MRKITLVFILLAAGIAVLLLRTKDPILPDPELTPGAIFPKATVEQICTPGYANVLNGGERNVPWSLKKQVFLEYFGSVPRHPGDYEVDHLISLELGGCNSINNLWPQSCLTKPWNSRVKDRLEDRMSALLRDCLKKKGHEAATGMLREFQNEIATNWTNAYVKYVGPAPGMATGAIELNQRK